MENLEHRIEHFPITEYFESPREWQEFSQEVTDRFNELISLGKTDISFDIIIDIYTEYGENYPELGMRFRYFSEMTEEEIEQKKKKDEKFAKDCAVEELLNTFEIDSMTWHSVKQSELLSNMLLSGDLVFKKKEVL